VKSRSFRACAAIFVIATVTACSDEPRAIFDPVGATLADSVRALPRIGWFAPFTRHSPIRPELVRLGEALAFDPVLSGPRNISCMTCHHPSLATGDGRSFSVGQGATGIGIHRQASANAKLTARNSTALFNLDGTPNLFHDGRVGTADIFGAYRTPAGDQLLPAMQNIFEFGALSAASMFPVIDRAEMRGHSGNELAAIADGEYIRIWAALMQRLGAIPTYRWWFEEAYPGTRFDDMTFAHASNAIAGYIIERFSFDNAPWSRFLRGDDRAMTDTQLRGARVFLTNACQGCHTRSGMNSDRFFNTVTAQIGPGAGNGPDGRDDFGRINVTQNPDDKYKFRTPTLWNVELTSPYGHAGQYATLRQFVDHYNDPAAKLRSYDVSHLEPSLRSTLVGNVEDVIRLMDVNVSGRPMLTAHELDLVVEFLKALTDPAARDLRRFVPSSVPSGLPIDR
jgi:cytochrome c peroxidase